MSPLRGYYEREVEAPDDEYSSYDRQRDKKTERVVVELQPELTHWLNAGNKDDPLRVICGGPGCGKSSFCKMFAASIAEAENRHVLFIPLHQLKSSADLVDALNRFIREDLDGILPPNPLEPDSVEEKILLIFDGLDELAMQGKIAEKEALKFIEEVQRKLYRFNQNQTRVMALLSGREVVVQSNLSNFRKEGQVVYVLPYFQTEEDRRKHRYIDDANLLKADQRQTWWQTYSDLKGKHYDGLPKELNRDTLTDITAQPLLNYLVALSYDQDGQSKLDFSTESNLNAIYEDLLKQVYKRDWAGIQHPALGTIELEDFIRLLEEIAIACWHGNGRTTTVGKIEVRCTNKRLMGVLGIFEGGEKEGVTRLLTAFYFRQSGIHGSEATFEFTHKSFGEYLAARRMVRGLRLIQDELARNSEDSDTGWDPKECLKQWTVLCGPAELDQYLLRFLQNEVLYEKKRTCIETVHAWQQTLCELINCMLEKGMPMEELSPRPSYHEERRQARNTEETLLAALNTCALTTGEHSSIQWATPTTARAWLMRLQGERNHENNPIGFECLSYLVLSGQDLSYVNLVEANLDGASLDGASLVEANLDGASLVGARLVEARLVGARLVEARLDRARLDRARLDRARLDGANLVGANLVEARLDGARLDGANLVEARLDGANLVEARLDRANLDRASLVQASLVGASLVGANLVGANLVEAIFKINSGLLEEDKRDFKLRGAIFPDDQGRE